MTRYFPAVLLIVSFLFVSCASNEIGDGKDVNPDAIYFDYKVWGDEEGGQMTMRLQYRFGGRNGTTLVLLDPAKVEVDGRVLQVDSSRMNGAYYEMTQPTGQFAGEHIIRFTGLDGKTYQESFSFQPIRLEDSIPLQLHRTDLEFVVKGLGAKDRIRILVSDTASFSEGIARVDTVIGGRVKITKEELRSLANGPINMELFKEIERPVTETTREGGRISISYGLKKEFILVD